TLTIINSTVSGNSATADGGAILNDGTLTILNSALSNNSATGFGGGIFNEGVPSTVNIKNSIVARGQSGDNCVNEGTINSQGHNISSDNSCFSSGGTDLLNSDPRLGPLQDNGGPTFTHALLTGSPAIDAGDDSVLGPPLNLITDQRGFPRPIDGN